MKKAFIFGGLFMFLFAGFRPPTGMSKFPTANIEFNEPAPVHAQVMMSTMHPDLVMDATDK